MSDKSHSKILRNDLTAEYVRSRLEYNPLTGIMVWKYRSDNISKGTWNKRFANKEAGHVSKSRGYRLISINHKLYMAHRLAFLIMTGRWPEHYIDHEKRATGDNRWAFIRGATQSENMRNRGPSTGRKYKGVYPAGASGKWKAAIQGLDKKVKYLGTFNTEEEAYAVFCAEARRLHGEFLCI